MTESDWNTCAQYAIKLFDFSQKEASKRGLILVDTKYEFGRDTKTGEILLIDEVQTPDSSRYWISDTYLEKFNNPSEYKIAACQKINDELIWYLLVEKKIDNLLKTIC